MLRDSLHIPSVVFCVDKGNRAWQVPGKPKFIGCTRVVDGCVIDSHRPALQTDGNMLCLLLYPAGAASSGHQEKKPFPIGSQLSGGGHNPLLLSPASLQLAQLQAQLTLHRLKLAQTAVNSNTAAAATVLNQVLSKVAMSQPLFNQITSSMVSTPHNHGGGTQLCSGMSVGRFASSGLPFPHQNSALGPLVSGGLGCSGNLQNQTPGAVGLHPYGGALSQVSGQHTSGYGNKISLSTNTMFPSDTDRRGQYGFLSGPPNTAGKTGEGPFLPSGAQSQAGSQGGFQRDFYGSGTQGPQGMGKQSTFSGEQNMNAFQPGVHNDQWQSQVRFPNPTKLEASNQGSAWVTSSQPFHMRGELYNPEEPTPDSKFNSTTGTPYSSNTQGFVGYQQLQLGEDTPSGGPMPLQPHQVNDFQAVTPAHLPHQCTICEKKVFNLKDWDQHVKGKLHLQNRALFSEGPALVPAQFSTFSEGCLNSLANNSLAYPSSVNQDVSSAPNSNYLPAAPMRSQPLSGIGFSSPQSGSKFPQRKSPPGRVVHICNLPEGSCTENDVINLGLPFGKVTNYILMRSTHQAFLEMAYVEAAQAMVQYYQQTPATINDQKLLIRMSKRYKELQLKKPGKDVDTIIQDINSQRERDGMQEVDRYPPERTRSRSPISRSLSPRSHSPSFTSCSSTHSPLGPSRAEWSNGMGERRASWDWSPHTRREEERDEACWRNGDEERQDSWIQDRRKPYLKMVDRVSPRSAEERGVALRGSRERYTRSSPQNPSYSLYRCKEDDFCKKELKHKSDRPPRPPHQRHEAKTKKRDPEEHHRPRYSDGETQEDTSGAARTPEDRRQASTERGRNKKPHRKLATEKEEQVSESQVEQQLQGQALSPNRKGKRTDEADEDTGKENQTEDGESGNETEGESWYPRNMEELVTVDEVGEEEDYIIEPDLPELQEAVEAEYESSEASKTAAGEKATQAHSDVCQVAKGTEIEVELTPEEHTAVRSSSVASNTSPKDPAPSSPPHEETTARPASHLRDFPSQEFQAVFAEVCSCTDEGGAGGNSPHPEEARRGGRDLGDGSKPLDILSSCETGKFAMIAKAVAQEMESEEERLREAQTKDTQLKSPRHSEAETRKAPSPALWDQENVFSEHSIPLGVEFVVPRSGFYCKLCGLFYTSEETAKTSHCRSSVHYRNLQKYLSQLAEESLHSTHNNTTSTEEPGIVPLFEGVNKPC
ncbi:RNA-binding protein 20 [Amia ocellicauda]|uniref:RNA-binding protein 20 n=1 Tax=Amia ocellicauda TaxID=2972642 RepID=UPI003463D324